MPETESKDQRLQKLERMTKALHDLSQPLTALQCGLYLGTMSPDGVQAPTGEQLLKTILDALEQTERLTVNVRAMQELLKEDEQDKTETGGE